MKIEFNEKQAELLKSLQINCASGLEYSNDDLDKIEEAVSEKLQVEGFDKDYNVTEIGEVCESILDLIADL